MMGSMGTTGIRKLKHLGDFKELGVHAATLADEGP